MAGGSSTSQRSSIASKSKSRASNASKASVRSNKSNADSGFAGYPVPWGSLIISAFCAVLHFELLDVSLFYVKNSCAGLYQVFYYKFIDELEALLKYSKALTPIPFHVLVLLALYLPAYNVCLVVKIEYMRILTCHFVHKTPWELVFQLVSLIGKGYQIEKRCGTKYILLMILMFAPLCSVILFIIHKVLADVYDPVFVTTCYCGLAAINLALKIVNQYQDNDDGPTCIYQDYCIKLKYICWFEVLLAHFVSDQSTIPAHVAGLLVGLLFISGILMKPLQFMMGCLSGGGTWSFSLRGWLGGSPSRGFGAPVKSKPSSRSSEPAVATTDHDPESESAVKSE